MPTIHPTSVIESGAQIAGDVVIGPLCYVGANVAIGGGTRLVSHVYLTGRTAIGGGNTIWPHTSIGADPQDLKYSGEDSQLLIGDNNDIRESVTIHKGTDNGGGVTRIGSHNLIMAGAHVAHDCHIGDHVIIASAVQLAGHVHLHDHVVVSGATAVHHYVTIGSYAFLGGMTRVVRDVPPFMIYEGNPGRIRGVNVIGLERNNVPADSIGHLKDAYRRLFKTNSNGDVETAQGNVVDNIVELERDCGGDRCIKTLISFVRSTATGIYGRDRENQRHDDRHHNPAR